MSLWIRIVIFAAGLALFAVIFELVRRKKFREELSLSWFFVAVIFMLSAVGDIFMDPVARFIRIGYPPALYFGWVVFCLVLVLLYFSVVISDLKGKIKELSQKVALMEFEIGEKKNERAKKDSDG